MESNASFREAFAKRVRARRKELGLTVAKCAEDVGRTEAAWRQYERAESAPGFDVLRLMAPRLCMSIGALFGESSEGES